MIIEFNTKYKKEITHMDKNGYYLFNLSYEVCDINVYYNIDLNVKIQIDDTICFPLFYIIKSNIENRFKQKIYNH